MKKKCNFCDATTKVNRGDLHEIKWCAFKMKKEKTVYACEKHNDILTKLIIKTINERRVADHENDGEIKDGN